MSERKELTVENAISPKKMFGMNAGEKTYHIYYVVWSEGQPSYRCALCGKDFDRFESAIAHYSHHGRTKESYIHAGTASGRTRAQKSVPTLEQKIREMLIANTLDLATDLADLMNVPAKPEEIQKLSDRIDALQEKLSAERKARLKAERDLEKIHKLFKSL